MKKDKLYIIRGTGLSLDGHVVKVVEVVGDYSVVSPPNLDSVHNTMIKTACLQELSNKSTSYTISISKTVSGSKKETQGPIELVIDNCPRDVSINTIADFITTNLKPILRME